MFVFKGFLIEHRFSKPRVTSSNLVGRAKKTLVLNPHFRCCIKDSRNIYFYLCFVPFSFHSRSILSIYIKSNPYLLAILNSEQVDSFYIVLRRLITFSNHRTVHSLFHMESYIARTARTRFSLAPTQRRLISIPT